MVKTTGLKLLKLLTAALFLVAGFHLVVSPVVDVTALGLFCWFMLIQIPTK